MLNVVGRSRHEIVPQLVRRVNHEPAAETRRRNAAAGHRLRRARPIVGEVPSDGRVGNVRATVESQ